MLLNFLYCAQITLWYYRWNGHSFWNAPAPCEHSPWSVGVIRVCGQVDINAATHSCIGSISSLLHSILLLLDGLREVLINKALEGFAFSKQNEPDLELEDTTNNVVDHLSKIQCDRVKLGRFTQLNGCPLKITKITCLRSQTSVSWWSHTWHLGTTCIQ